MQVLKCIQIKASVNMEIMVKMTIYCGKLSPRCNSYMLAEKSIVKLSEISPKCNSYMLANKSIIKKS